eukprot:SAG31_NODE_3358_length_4367_cov_1.988051_1_plen_190_part_00
MWTDRKAAAVAEQTRNKKDKLEEARLEAIAQRRTQLQQLQSGCDASTTGAHSDPHSHDMMRVLREHLVLYNTEGPLRECLQVIRKIIVNVLENPSDSKFRRIKGSKQLLADRVLAVRGGAAFLKAAGFDTVIQDFEEYYMCDELDDVLVARLQLAVECIDKELANAEMRAAGRHAKEAERQRMIARGST